MEETIQIKCPWCNAVLSVRNQAGIENKFVTCPVCKQKSPFSQFKRNTVNVSNDDCTQYPGAQISMPQENYTIGRLVVQGKGLSYQLKLGKNIIGRKASNSSANFQIDMGENRRMSREHIMIEVKKIPGRGISHLASLFKEKVNQTEVGSEKLVYGDCIILKNGDIIKLPGVNVLFEIPDDDATQLQ